MLQVFRIAAVLLIAVFTLFAQPTAAQQSQALSNLLPLFKNVPGLAALPASDVKKNATSTSARVSLRGKPATVMAFKVNGVTLGAIVPDKFLLTDIMPIPRGTPVDGVAFSNMVFIYLPKGSAQTTLSVTTSPQILKNVLTPVGSKLTLKEGFSLYGIGNFQSSTSMRQVLSAIGDNSKFSFPLAGNFSADLFKFDPRTASAQVKNSLLASLKLNLPLPKIKFPGMPDVVAVDNARLSIVGHAVNGKPKVFAGVTGDLAVKLGSTAHRFNFDFLAADPGKAFQPKITASSKDPVRLPFVQPLDLTDMKFVAEKKGNTWNTVVNANAKLKGKPIAVSVRHDPRLGDMARINTKLTLADVLPSGTTLPGVTDVEFDTIELAKGLVQVTGKIKGLDTVIAGFQHNGRTVIALATPQPLHISNLVPQIGKTPLDDVSFNAMTYLWAPKGMAASSLKTSALPPAIAAVAEKAGGAITVKAGLNIVGQLGIERNGELGKLLTMAGLYKSSLPLAGALSPAIFHAGNTAQIKNEILENLDLNVPLPKINVPGVSTVASIQHTALTIKGQNVNGVRSVDAAIGGELDFALAGTKLQLDYKASIHKQSGQPDTLALSAKQPKGKTVTVKLLETFKISDLDFRLTKKNGKYDALLLGNSTFRGKRVGVGYSNSPKPKLWVSASNLMLKDLIGTSIGVPEIDNIAFSGFAAFADQFNMGIKVRSHLFYASVSKVPGQSKPFIVLRSAEPKLFIADFVPGAEKTPLKDTDFKGVSFLYNPTNKTGPVGTFPDSIRPYFSNNLVVKPGLNLFGDLEVHPTGEMASLLKMAGITEIKLPLNGGFSTKIFSTDSTAVKNAILDNLDLRIPLPKLNIPGVSKVANIQSTNLTIKGGNNNGVRSVDVAVGGEMDISLTGTKVVLDYEADVHKQQGQPNSLAFLAKQAEDKPVSFKLVEPLTMKGLEFDLTKKGKDYVVLAKGQVTFRNKAIEMTYIHEPDPNRRRLTFGSQNFTLADLTGNLGLPGLDEVKIGWTTIWKDRIDVSTQVRDIKVWSSFAKVPGQSKPSVLVYTQNPKVPPAEFIPGAENTPLKDVDFEHPTFFFNPTNQTIKVAESKLPSALTQALRFAGKDAVIKPGLNFFGALSVHPTGEMATLLKDVGVTALSLPLSGGFSPKAFATNLGAVKNEILDGLDIQLNIPTPHIPEMAQFLTFRNGHLGIKGKLPDGKRGIAFQVSGDTELKIANQDIAFFVEVDAARSQDGRETDFEVKGHTDKPWVHPLGISFLTLEELALDIRKQKTGNVRTYDVSLSAKTDIGRHSKLAVLVDIHEEGNKLTDVFFELDGPLQLSDIPELNRVPHADKFALTKLIVSEHGVEADTILGGHATDFFAFHGSGWNVALTQKDFAITELLPPLKNTPLKEIKFPFLALMLSESGLDKQFSQLSKVGQDALKEIFTHPSDTVKIDKGLALIAGFHPDSAGTLKDGIKGIGVSDSVIVLGEIDGIFGGSPLVKLEGKISKTGKAHHMPNGTSYQTGAEIAFFINVLESGQDFDFELGLEVGVLANVHGDNLLFDSRVKMEIMEEGFGIDVEGQMKGTWHKPFGINGFSLSDVTIELGTQEDGAIKLGFGGATVIANQHFKMAADGKFLPEALGFPQAIAFIGSADTLPLLFVEDIALKMLAKQIKFDLPRGVMPVFKDVKFAFATPGAEDPDLKIDGEGFALKGGLQWLGHELGAVNMSVSPTKGIYVADKIDDINLGPLKLTDNHFTMKAGLKNIVPTVSVNADIEIKYLGIHEKFDVNFDKKGASFETTAKFGKDFSMHNLLRLSGIDLSVTKPNFTNADFFMEGDMKLDIGKFVEEPATAALNAVFKELKAGFDKAEEDIKAARAKVNSLTGQINAERAKVRKERAAVEAKLQAAEDRVNSLNGEIDRDWSHYHGCSGWFSWACKARWGIEIGFLKGARDVADAALELAKTTVDHFPLDFDPRIAPLIVARDGAKAVLTAALDAFEGADIFNKILKEVTGKVVELVGKSVNINKAAFQGDLRGLIDGSQPLAVTLDAEVFGSRIEQIIPFNPRNIGYDVEQMSFIGLRALHHIITDVLKEIPGPIKHKILGYTSSQIGIQQDAAKKELAKYGKAFASYTAKEAALQKVIAALDKSYMQQKYAESHNPMDHDVSAAFANDFIEIGHTALCLDNVGGVIKQDRCQEGASTRWSTKPVDGAPEVPANAGYVQIIDAKTGSCVVPEGKWAEVKKEFTGPGLSKDDTFSYPVNTFVGDGKINVGTCENKREYYWKILKHGEGWMQIANRATSKCLHFKDSSSLPGQATAEWASCTGSANQVYRVADTTTPEYYASKIALKNDSQSACFSDPGADGKITMVDCTKGAQYNYVIDVRGYIKFINTKTGLCMQPENYQNGAHLLEKPCTQLDYQWWNPIDVPGGWRIQNAQTNTCTRAPGLGKVAVTETCRDWAQSVIAPVIDPYSGITYTSATSGALAATIPSTASNGSGICTVQIPSAGNSQVTGTASNDNKCRYNYNGGNQTQPTGGKNLLVTVLDGTLWQAHRAVDKIPEYAIPGGFINDGAKSKATYICRAKRATQSGWVTKFGWVAEQDPKENYCHYPTTANSEDESGHGRSSWDYEVLVRRADKAYLLNLSDWKPGGTKAGKDPVVKALASQVGHYRGEKTPLPVSMDPKVKNGTPLNGWTGTVTITTVGDIVTLKGRFGGNRVGGGGNGQSGPVWKLPANLAPQETLVFSVPSSNSNTGKSILQIRPDGIIYAMAGNFLFREGYVGVIWIDLPDISYGTQSAKLLTEGSWGKKYSTFASPSVIKVGKRVVVNGLATGYSRPGHVRPPGQAIARLPQGSRPSKKLSFKIIGGVDSGDVLIDVYPDGRIVPNGGNLINLSGISFDAGGSNSTFSGSYGQLLNSWKPDSDRSGSNSFTVSDDIVTLRGGVAGGQGIDKIWQLPQNARPSEVLVFNVNNSSGAPLRLEIHPSGLVKGSGASSNVNWISFSGVTFNRRGGTTLGLSEGWGARSGFAKPAFTKNGIAVIFNGVVTRTTISKRGPFGIVENSGSISNTILRLPFELRPKKSLTFKVSRNIDGQHARDASVGVNSDGWVVFDGNADDHTISLSGISFDVP